VPTTRTRCHDHERQHDRARGTRAERGYTAEHDRLRAQLVATYHPADPCARCRLPLGPNPGLLDLGHTDDRRGWRGLEHRRCNRGAARKRRLL
jgi:hypothetical protein